MVGPWCFFDRFGPMTFTSGKPMDVAPHPHIGLQTVSWLMSGEVMHNDSKGGDGAQWLYPWLARHLSGIPAGNCINAYQLQVATSS